MEKHGNDRGQRKADLIHFLQSTQKPGHPIKELDEHGRLLESVLINKLAFLQIGIYREQPCNLNFFDKGIDPAGLGKPFR